MDSTLVICENKPLLKELCSIIKNVLGPTESSEPLLFDGDLEEHPFVALIFTVEKGRLPDKMAVFLSKNSAELLKKRVAVLCVCDDEKAAAELLKKLHRRLGTCVYFSKIISQKYLMTRRSTILNKMSRIIIELKRSLKDTSDMPQAMLAGNIYLILHSHNTCCLCTTSGGRVRVTPMEYIFKNSYFYFTSEGGEKFANMSANKHVSIAVCNAYTGFEELESVQIEGIAEPVDMFSEEYLDIAKQQQLDAEKLRSLPVELHIFKVIPNRYEVIKSDFAKDGFCTKQILNLPLLEA